MFLTTCPLKLLYVIASPLTSLEQFLRAIWNAASCSPVALCYSPDFHQTQLCLTLCDTMDCSTLGFPVYQRLPELTQTHVHRVGDAIQPSHPLSSPSPPTFNPSQHQGLFKWVGSSHQVAKVLKFQLQHQSFQWIFRTDFLQVDRLTLLAVLILLPKKLQLQLSCCAKKFLTSVHSIILSSSVQPRNISLSVLHFLFSLWFHHWNSGHSSD